MLTKEDLLAIQKLIQQGNNALEKKLEEKFKRYFKREIRSIINYFDREYLGLKKRVGRVEDHLGLPPII
jgi:hypothetical protein